MDFSTHSRGPKDPSPDHAELVEAVTKGMLIQSWAHPRDCCWWFSTACHRKGTCLEINDLGSTEFLPRAKRKPGPWPNLLREVSAWATPTPHSQMEGEQGTSKWIMILSGSCSDSRAAASWVLSGLEVSPQRWVSRRPGEAGSVVNSSDVGRTFTSLLHKGLWTVETADIALGLSQHYHAVRMFIWTNLRKRLSHAYLNVNDSEAFEDRKYHFFWPSGYNRGHGITVIPAQGPCRLGCITLRKVQS